MDRWLHDGKLWAEWTFRGKNLGIYEFTHDLNRSDWRIIHKHEEPQFLNNKNSMKDVVFSDTFPLPPLYVCLLQFKKTLFIIFSGAFNEESSNTKRNTMVRINGTSTPSSFN